MHNSDSTASSNHGGFHKSDMQGEEVGTRVHKVLGMLERSAIQGQGFISNPWGKCRLRVKILTLDLQCSPGEGVPALISSMSSSRVSSLNIMQLVKLLIRNAEGMGELSKGHHGGFHMFPHMLQLGSRSLVVGDILVLGMQQSCPGTV